MKSISIEDEEHLVDLVNMIRKRKIILFLGAGASIVAGAPSTEELIAKIHEKFPLAQTSDDFNTFCGNIRFSSHYKYSDLYDFIRETFENLQPSKYHKLLTSYDWGAIFTTNYDRLLEQAYENPDVIKPPRVIASSEDTINPLSRRVCHIFKLNGCISREIDEVGAMKLTKVELMGAALERERSYEILSDILKDGILLFIGYSFRDLLMLQVIESTMKKFGIVNIRHSYALFRDPENLNQTQLAELQYYRILPIKADFQSFFEYLSKQFSHKDQMSRYQKELSLEVKNQKILIPWKDTQYYLNHFKILCEECISERTTNKEAFFRGEDHSWGPFNHHWDFERFFYSKDLGEESIEGKYQNLKTLIKIKLESNNESDFSKVLVQTGIPGIGKTTIAKRIAIDFYQDGNLVLYIDSNSRGFDFQSVLHFIERIYSTIDFEKDPETNLTRVPILIIVDNVSDWIGHMIHLKRRLIFSGYLVLIIGFERNGIWQREKKRKTSTITNEVLELPLISSEFQSQEKDELISHLKNIEIIEEDETQELDKIRIEEESFFGLMYSLVHPTKQRLNEIIRNQYSSLSPKAIDIFTIICFLSQYNLSINYAFLARIAGYLPWKILVDEIIHGEASGVIYEEEDEDGNLFYRTHHRIIAEKTIEYFHDDPKTKTDFFIRIFKNANEDYDYEKNLCEKIAIDQLSSNRLDSEFTLQQLDEIFSNICTTIPSSALFHHWALINKQMRKFNRSRSLLQKATNLHSEERSQGRRAERLSYINTSWGVLCAEEGYAIRKSQKDPHLAERLFNEAETRFEAALNEDASNAPTYTAETYMYLRRANTSNNNLDKIYFLKKALELIGKAKTNVIPSELLIFDELTIEVQAQLQAFDLNKLNRLANVIFSKFKSISGYYILAKSLILKARKEVDQTSVSKCSSKALEVIEKGLSL
ncbi:MAG: SIR2 family protein, partial [Candidatus Hodarchaeales archaeon]